MQVAPNQYSQQKEKPQLTFLQSKSGYFKQLAILLLLLPLSTIVHAQKKYPEAVLPHWDFNVLGKAPTISPAPANLDRPGLRALFYSGLPYKGKKTKVFAWIGVPEHKPGVRVPGVVLIHGGGGTASDGGVLMWVKRGYAAISMDTTGSYPGRNLEQHAEGGPRGNGECFAQITEPVTEQWMYHAVADVALANSLLRSLPDVDSEKIGLTGLSWGGVVAGVAAGIDTRFKWVAPVYGCGFLQSSEYFKPVLDAYQGEKWIALWDPSRYLKNAGMPTLWINGTNDTYFQMDMWQRTHRLASGPRTISLIVRMPHSGADGENPEEIHAFADSMVNGGTKLPRVLTVTRKDASVTASFAPNDRLTKAEIVYTRDTGKWSSRLWETQTAKFIHNGKQIKVTGILPPGTTTWYIRVENERKLNVTTDFEALPAPIPPPAALPGNAVYVSPSGSDINPGTIAKPVASLTRARDIARALPRTAPIRVILRGGVYRLSSPLELNTEDSGTETAPVIWSAASGEKVTISAGVPLSGWKTTKVNGKTAWSLTIPEVKLGEWYFRSLFSGSERRQRARMPNKGFFVVAGLEDRPKSTAGDAWLDGRDKFYYAKGDLSEFRDKTNAEVVMLTQWCDSHLPVTAIDPEKRLISFSKFTIQDFGTKDRYWIENTVAALDTPGEWCLNRKTGVLFYLPLPGETPKNTTLIAPRGEALVTLKGTANVTFSHLTFSYTEWWFPPNFHAASKNSENVWAFQQGADGAGGTIQADKITGCTFSHCEFSHIGGYGAVLAGASKNNRIIRCDFHDLGAGGVRLGPQNVGADYQSDVAIGNVISDCNIYDGCKQFQGAVAVWTGHVQKTQITHNDIHDFNYTGISCGWIWGFERSGISRDNEISWNRIYNIGRNVLGDGAGIYMLGGQPGTVIEGNVVHDANGTYASRGIYLDDGSSEMTVRNNLSYRNKTANFFQWRSKNNRIENNVFAFGKEAQVELGGAVFNDGALAMNFERNIILTDNGPLLNGFNPSAVAKIYQFDRNLYWRIDGKPFITQGMRDAGWDKNSLEADPLFVDPVKDDFRLGLESPALSKIGFKPVDWSKAGPRK